MYIDRHIFQQDVHKFLLLAGTQDVPITSMLYMHILQFIFMHARTAGRRRKEKGRVRKSLYRFWKSGRKCLDPISPCKKIIQNFLYVTVINGVR